MIRSIGAATPAQTAYFAYDKNSNLTSYTDPKANPATTYTYDALQRLKTQTDSASGVVTLVCEI
jgi:YD repeat-containing protein